MTRRTLDSEPATALRAALVAPWPELSRAARRLVRRAVLRHRTRREAAESLGIGVRTLERILEADPTILPNPPQST